MDGKRSRVDGPKPETNLENCRILPVVNLLLFTVHRIALGLGFGGAIGGFDFNSEYGGIGLIMMGGIVLSSTLIGSLVGVHKKKYKLDEKADLNELLKKGIRYSF